MRAAHLRVDDSMVSGIESTSLQYGMTEKS